MPGLAETSIGACDDTGEQKGVHSCLTWSYAVPGVKECRGTYECGYVQEVQGIHCKKTGKWPKHVNMKGRKVEVHDKAESRQPHTAPKTS